MHLSEKRGLFFVWPLISDTALLSSCALPLTAAGGCPEWALQEDMELIEQLCDILDLFVANENIFELIEMGVNIERDAVMLI